VRLINYCTAMLTTSVLITKFGGLINRTLLRGISVQTHLHQSRVSEKVPKIYTKTGDKGLSATFTGERRPKDDIIFETLGNTDELNCAIGLARELSLDSGVRIADRLEQIQCALQDVSSSVATPKSSARESHTAKTAFDEENVKQLERWIDEYTDDLAPLKNFILPSGGKTSACLHLARAVCRRAERSASHLLREGELDAAPFIYLNRLSDFLFTAARFAAMREGKTERIYIRPAAKKLAADETTQN